MDNYLIHFGNKNSGRYPRGSGEHPYQHDGMRNIYNLNRKQRKTIDKNLSKYREQDIDESNVDNLVRDLNRKNNINRNVNELNTSQSFKHSKKIGGKVVDALLIATATVAVKDLLSDNSKIRSTAKNSKVTQGFKSAISKGLSSKAKAKIKSNTTKVSGNLLPLKPLVKDVGNKFNINK